MGSRSPALSILPVSGAACPLNDHKLVRAALFRRNRTFFILDVRDFGEAMAGPWQFRASESVRSWADNCSRLYPFYFAGPRARNICVWLTGPGSNGQIHRQFEFPRLPKSAGGCRPLKILKQKRLKSTPLTNFLTKKCCLCISS